MVIINKMDREGLAQPATAQVDYLQVYGLSAFELSQAAKCPYIPAGADPSRYTGNLQDMLDRAPVMADRLATMHRERGFAGTKDFLSSLAMTAGVEIQVHDATQAFHDGKITREALQIQTTPARDEARPARGTGDFLG